MKIEQYKEALEQYVDNSFNPCEQGGLLGDLARMSSEHLAEYEARLGHSCTEFEYEHSSQFDSTINRFHLTIVESCIECGTWKSQGSASYALEDMPEVDVEASSWEGGFDVSWDSEEHGLKESRTHNEDDQRRREIAAVVCGLEGLIDLGPCRVTVFSTAFIQTVIKEQWLIKWESQGWKTKNGKSIVNQDLWSRLLESLRSNIVTVY